ncbi:MAG: hypothetical protein PVI30_12435 [Myxococcales bacterium]
MRRSLPLWLWSFIGILSCSISPRPLAAEAPETRAPEAQAQEPGYATSIMLADVVAGGALMGGLAVTGFCVLQSGGVRDASPPGCAVGLGVASAGIGTYLLASPIIHASHGNVPAVFAAPAVRLAGPVLGAWVSREVPSFGRLNGYPVMILGGLGGALAFDWYVLAGGPARQRPATTRLQPLLGGGLAGVTLYGRL